MRGAVVLAIVTLGGPAFAQPTEPAPPAPAQPAEPPPPAPAPVDLSGYLQADLVPWAQASLDELDPATGDPLNETRVLIRRARLHAERTHGNILGAVELDGNTIDGPRARIISAYASIAYPALGDDATITGTAGLIKIPFGAEVPESDQRRAFLEPSTTARALFPGNYDAGLAARASWRYARATIAVMNGAPVADAQFSGRDPTTGFDLLGRVGVDVQATYAIRVRAGMSALIGEGLSPGAAPTKDEIQWIDDNEDGLVQQTELRVIPGEPGSPSVLFDRNAIGADLRIDWCTRGMGPGGLIAEAVIATNLDRGVVYADPVRATRDLREAGWHIGVFQSVTPWAQLGARLDRYEPDRDASEAQGAEVVVVDTAFTTLSVFGAVHRGDAKLTMEYHHENNPLGRDDDGAPTTLAADRVTLRAQVGF